MFDPTSAVSGTTDTHAADGVADDGGVADAQLRAALAGLDAAVAALDAVDTGMLLGSASQWGLERVCGLERRIASVRLRLVRRVEDTGVWRRDGHRSAAAALAAATGTSPVHAGAMARTARIAADNGELADALAAGTVSEQQLTVLAPAVKADPTAASALLDTARRCTHRELRAKVDAIVAASTTSTARDRKAWDDRGVHISTDPAAGTARLVATGPAGIIAGIAGRIDAQAAEVLRTHNAAEHGKRTRTQRQFDAMVSLLGCGALLHAPDGEQTPPDATIAPTSGTGRACVTYHVHLTPHRHRTSTSTAPEGPPSTPADDPTHDPNNVHDPNDVRDVRPGHPPSDTTSPPGDQRSDPPPGDTSEVLGFGPVPAAFARSLIDDEPLGTIVEIVLRDGTDPHRIVRYERGVPAILRTALLVRDGPCSIPHCDTGGPTHADHDPVDYAEGAPLSMATANNKCWLDHHAKTHLGHRLLGDPDDRVWIDADGNIVTADQPDHPPLPDLIAAQEAKAAAIRQQIAAHRAS